MNKRGIVTEYLPWVLIAIAVLAILSISIFILRDSGTSLVDSIRRIFGGN